MWVPHILNVLIALFLNISHATNTKIWYNTKLWCLHYLISTFLCLHLKSFLSTRSLQFICATAALESFLLSWPIQECQQKWEGIKAIASRCPWIITGCGGHITFWHMCEGVCLILPSAAMGFDWSLMLSSHRVIALLSRWHWTVQGDHSAGLSTCMYLITVSLMVLHLALRHVP